MKTQKQMLLAALEKGKILTSWDAIVKYGCTKLSTRIGEINDPRIHRAWESGKNRHGFKIKWRIYWIPENLRK